MLASCSHVRCFCVRFVFLTCKFRCEQDKLSKDDFLGGFMIDLREVPPRKPPESPLAPQWYRLESKSGKGRVSGTFYNRTWKNFILLRL